MLHQQHKQTPSSPSFPTLIATQCPPSSGIVNVFKTRSNEGFEIFLRRDYVNKLTKGDFLSVKSYMGNLAMFLKLTLVNPERFHQMNNGELQQLIVRFCDLPPAKIRKTSIDNINSTFSAYKDYVRYTKGLYNQVKSAA